MRPHRPSYLEKHMLAVVGENVKWLDKKQTALYINVALVAEKPLTINRSASSL